MIQINSLDQFKSLLLVHDAIDIINADGSIYLSIKGGHGSNPTTLRYTRPGNPRTMEASVKQIFNDINSRFTPNA